MDALPVCPIPRSVLCCVQLGTIAALACLSISVEGQIPGIVKVTKRCMQHKDVGGNVEAMAEPILAPNKSKSVPDGPFIFVSYSSKDSDIVHPEIRRLEEQGHEIWYDKRHLQLGNRWVEDIREAIEACACFMIFITHNAVGSDNVCDEIEQALAAGKPFICIYWEKVELPARFEKPIRSIQALERYAMRRLELQYEEPLSRALSRYTEFKPEEKDKKPEKAPVLPSPDTRTDVLPKIVFFMLLLLAVISLFLVVVVVVTPYFPSSMPGDPLNNHWTGYLVGLFFLIITFGLCGVAYAVHRIYLRRKK